MWHTMAVTMLSDFLLCNQPLHEEAGCGHNTQASVIHWKTSLKRARATFALSHGHHGFPVDSRCTSTCQMGPRSLEYSRNSLANTDCIRNNTC